MKRGKRLLALLLAAIMTLSLCACGKKKESGGATAEIGDIKNTTFAPADFEVTDYKGEIGRYFVSNGNIYFLTNEYTDEPVDIPEDATESDAIVTSINHLYTVPVTGGAATEVAIPEVNDDSYIGNIFAGKDGSVGIVVESWDDEAEESKKTGYLVDSSGQVKNLDVSSYYADQTDDVWLQSLTGDGKGGVIACYSDSIKLFDENAKKTADIKIGSDQRYTNVGGVTVLADGTVLAAIQEESGVSVRVLDMAAGQLADTYPLDLSYMSSNDCLMPGSGDYDFFYVSGTGVFGYKLLEKKATQILDYTASDIDSNNLSDQYMVDAETFLCTAWGYDSGDKGSGTFMMYKKVDPAQVADKKTLVCMSMYGNSELKQRVIEYNKKSTEYRIQFLDYSEKEDPRAAMSADIASGKIPDIYDVSNGVGNLSVKQCIAKGMFEDLSPYYEKDPEVNKDDLIPGVYDALCVDGKVYFTSSSVYIVTLAARGKDMQGRTGWTFDEMREYVESKPDAQMFYWTNNKTQLLNNFLYLSVDDFVDWNAGTCKFDTPEFAAILELCNRGTSEETDYNEDMPSESEMIQKGKVLFTECNITPDFLAMNDAVYNHDVCYIGYPSSDRQGSLFSFSDCLAISSSCGDKDAAWDFIKQSMSREAQGKSYVMYGSAYYSPCPTRKDIFEMWLTACSTTKEYTDEFGNEIQPVGEGSMGWDGVQIETKPLTKEQVQLIRDAVDNTKKGLWYDDSLLSIIKEEAEGYFKGDKSVKEVCSVIQNRVTTYVNENK